MAGQVLYTREFGEWHASLNAEQRALVARAVAKLVENPLRPPGLEVKSIVDAGGVGVAGILQANVSQGKHVLRVYYAFDPQRDAILLIGGNKKGAAAAKGTRQALWNVKMAKQAAAIFGRYITRLATGVRDATPVMNLPQPAPTAAGEHEDLAHEIARKTGWDIAEVRKLMRKGGVLDPTTSAGEDRILEIITRPNDKTDGLGGLGMAPKKYVRGDYDVTVERIVPGLWAVTFDKGGRNFTINVNAATKREAIEAAIERARDRGIPGFDP